MGRRKWHCDSKKRIYLSRFVLTPPQARARVGDTASFLSASMGPLIFYLLWKTDNDRPGNPGRVKFPAV